jgi:spermidine/putrescine transport system substrate-binding protein
VAENILYKVPNQAAMDAVLPGLVGDFPNMGFTAEQLLGYEGLVDLGDAAALYTRLATEITSG